jgi:hypothetical protein
MDPFIRSGFQVAPAPTQEAGLQAWTIRWEQRYHLEILLLTPTASDTFQECWVLDRGHNAPQDWVGFDVLRASGVDELARGWTARRLYWHELGQAPSAVTRGMQAVAARLGPEWSITVTRQAERVPPPISAYPRGEILGRRSRFSFQCGIAYSVEDRQCVDFLAVWHRKGLCGLRDHTPAFVRSIEPLVFEAGFRAVPAPPNAVTP